MLDLQIVILLLIFAVVCVYFWISKRLDYFKKQNIFYIKPSCKPNDLYRACMDNSRTSFYVNLYESTEPHKCVGVYRHLIFMPALILRDPELIRLVLFKHFENFSTKPKLFYGSNDSSSYFLTNLSGERWHWVRIRLASAFTSNRMKFLITLFDKPAAELIAKLNHEIDEPVAIFSSICRYQMRVMAFSIFGLDDDVSRDEKSLFYSMTCRLAWQKSFMLDSFHSVIPRAVRSAIWGRVLNSEAENFFKRLVEDTVYDRNRYDFTNSKHDFLQHFMRLMQNPGNLEGQTSSWTLESTAAQCILLLIGGLDAPSALISLALHEIAKSPAIQQRLFEELKEKLEKSNGQITYEGMQAMVYLNNVVLETLRKYPLTSAIIQRECVKTCQLSNTDVVVEKGTHIIIPVRGIHYNPKFYPEPEIFDPNRFDEENMRCRHPFTFLPFGKGPRNCLAQTFAVFCLKYVIIQIISEFELRSGSNLSHQFISLEEFLREANDIKILFTRRKPDEQMI